MTPRRKLGRVEEPQAAVGEVLDNPAPASPSALIEWTPQFVVSVDQAVQLAEQKREYLRLVMKEGVHYGSLPGLDKKILFLPGAQTLSSNMALHPIFGDAASPVEDWTGEHHRSVPDDKPEPFVAYRRYCELRRQTGPGPEEYMVVARAEGSCNSWESKYRYREARRVCPACGKETIIKGKAEYGGGWICFAKRGGCGAKYQDKDERITAQAIGRVLNIDVLDQANTILKMADKRAYVAATLQATGCADIFTQDLEADEASSPADDEPPHPAESAPVTGKGGGAPSTPSTQSPPTRRPGAGTEAAEPDTAAAGNAAFPPPPPVPPRAPPRGPDRPAAPPSPLPAPAQPAAAPAAPAPPTATSEESARMVVLRQTIRELVLVAQRRFAQTKYPDQTFPEELIQARARNSVQAWSDRELGQGKPNTGPTLEQMDYSQLQRLLQAAQATK